MAPYEADAQMAFLAKSRSVHAVITEDSDLLTYGCPRVRASSARRRDSVRTVIRNAIVHYVCRQTGACLTTCQFMPPTTTMNLYFGERLHTHGLD